MKEIKTWKHEGWWVASRTFVKDQTIVRSVSDIRGFGKTKKQAISNLCAGLMSLSEEIRGVVHEVNMTLN